MSSNVKQSLENRVFYVKCCHFGWENCFFFYSFVVYLTSLPKAINKFAQSKWNKKLSVQYLRGKLKKYCQKMALKHFSVPKNWTFFCLPRAKKSLRFDSLIFDSTETITFWNQSSLIWENASIIGTTNCLRCLFSTQACFLPRIKTFLLLFLL